MSSFITTSRGGTVDSAPARSPFWQRFSARIKQAWGSRDGSYDPGLLLPTYEATDRELQRLAEPAFRERIDQVRTEVFTRFVTGG